MSRRASKAETPRESWWDGEWAGDDDDQKPPIPMSVTVTRDGRTVDPSENPLTPPPGESTGHVDTARSEAIRGWWNELDSKEQE